MTEVVVVLCTASVAEAPELADALLTARVAACVNLVGPVESRYRWQGRLEVGREMLLIIKTTAACVPALRQRILDCHSYDVPEIVELQVAGGHAAYLEWVAACCRGETGAAPE